MRGGISRAISASAEKAARVAQFDTNPTRCAACRIALTYKQRHNRYCTIKCKAAVVRRPKTAHLRYVTVDCRACGQGIITDPKKPQRHFCNNMCQRDHQFEVETIPRVLAGEVTTRTVLKRYLVRIRGHRCEVCRMTEWMGKSIPIEVDHVDGDASNNMPSNIRLLCPNCHAQTPTAKGRNRGKGRKSRGIAIH